MSTATAVLLGAVLAIPVLVPLRLLGRERALDLVAIQLAAVAAVYAGSGLAGADSSTTVAEILVVFGFFAASLVGRWFAPSLLVFGYFAHGAWDAMHHVGSISTMLPAWYAPFCLGFDWAVAAFVAVVVLPQGDPAVAKT